jgi:hypothetical protein
MAKRTAAPTDIKVWDAQIAANTEQFRQADLLDDAAYKIIEDDQSCPDTWDRFAEAKARADTQRTKAYCEWMQIKREMNK